MQQEFMLHIRNIGDGKVNLNQDEHLTFVKQCESYIQKLKDNNQLIAAQPIIRQGVILTKVNNEFITNPINEHAEIQVGYYHIKAENLDEAISIAKENPEFAFVPLSTIEVRPLKTKEPQTGFEYPTK